MFRSAHGSDAEITQLLARTISLAEPVLTTLRTADPCAVKPRTFPVVDYSGPAGLAARVLDAASWPGTGSWAEASMNERAGWWTHRVGALNTLGVAAPGFAGGWAKLSPATPVLRMADQALIVLAVAQEYGVTERRDQLALLAAALFDRDLAAAPLPAEGTTAWAELWRRPSRTEAVKALWNLTMLVRSDVLEPPGRLPGLFRKLSWIPVVGAPATYAAELIGLSAAVRRARTWITEHPEAISADGIGTDEISADEVGHQSSR
ncbi:hypothetical protein [Gordonia sp. VNK21]|uniref:hypothetical protein n=1 Tax=Gordonia sp. VNK21 TaxID=3382483 RepID=UPI0038D48A88